jgi:hypothetical protein
MDLREEDGRVVSGAALGTCLRSGLGSGSVEVLYPAAVALVYSVCLY